MPMPNIETSDKLMSPGERDGGRTAGFGRKEEDRDRLILRKFIYQRLPHIYRRTSRQEKVMDFPLLQNCLKDIQNLGEL